MPVQLNPYLTVFGILIVAAIFAIVLTFTYKERTNETPTVQSKVVALGLSKDSSTLPNTSNYWIANVANYPTQFSPLVLTYSSNLGLYLLGGYGDLPNNILYSSDGLTWNTANGLSKLDTVSSIRYLSNSTNQKVFAMGATNDGDPFIASSTNGIDWTYKTISRPTTNNSSIVWGFDSDVNGTLFSLAVGSDLIANTSTAWACSNIFDDDWVYIDSSFGVEVNGVAAPSLFNCFGNDVYFHMNANTWFVSGQQNCSGSLSAGQSNMLTASNASPFNFHFFNANLPTNTNGKLAPDGLINQIAVNTLDTAYMVAVGQDSSNKISLIHSTDSGVSWNSATDDLFGNFANGATWAQDRNAWYAIGQDADNIPFIASSSDALVWATDQGASSFTNVNTNQGDVVIAYGQLV